MCRHPGLNSIVLQIGRYGLGLRQWEPTQTPQGKIAKTAKQLDHKTDTAFLDTIAEESSIKTVGFHDIHNICKRNKLECPSFDKVMEQISAKGFNVSRTHFTGFGLRSDIDEDTLLKIIRSSIKK